jgi:NADH-quinone oxidoreductase subunit C/D
MHPFLESLVNRFPQAVMTAQQDPVRLDLWAQVKAESWRDIAQFLHDDPSMALDHITDICSADYPDDLERFEVIYHFLSLPHGTRLRMKARVTEEHPEIASITDIWQGANFLEREVYDLMGIRFTGHPDLRRILMPEDYD